MLAIKENRSVCGRGLNEDMRATAIYISNINTIVQEQLNNVLKINEKYIYI